jgi:hypothetical protein
MRTETTFFKSGINQFLERIQKYGFRSYTKDINNKHRPGKISIPKLPTINDKIIIVKYLQTDYLIQAIHQYCNLVNQEKYTILPRLFMNHNLLVITFPYDIEFDKFCFFVNYMGNAHELRNRNDYQPNITAWCTTHSVDNWLSDELINKEIMLFIPEGNSKQDKVFLTTTENNGFIMSFNQSESLITLEKSTMMYQKMPVDVNLLNYKKHIDFN